MAKLVWEKTGDVIDINPVNHEVYAYFVENLNQHNQNFYKLQSLELENQISDLTDHLITVDTFFQTKFNIQRWDLSDIDLLDQCQLNRLHRVWVELHLQYPNIADLSDQINPGMAIQLHKINKGIHKLEESFNWLSCRTPDSTVSFFNPFGTKILNFDTAGIQVDYNNLGRSTYNKWKNFDNQVDSNDTNDFKEMYTSIIVSLAPPATGVAPKEYMSWAKDHNIQPHGSTLNLAQFDKLEENLLKYRKLFYKNSSITDNYFTLKE
jgi:hypothetical protein